MKDSKTSDMKYYKLKGDDEVCFYDKLTDRMVMRYLYDEGEITQKAIFLEDEDDKISNKKLVLCNHQPDRKNKWGLFYDKAYVKNGNLYKEYYINDELDSYFITEKTNKKTEESGYCAKGEIFATTIYYYNRFEQAYKEKHWVATLNEPDLDEFGLMLHEARFGDFGVIEYDYEEEEKDYPEFKIDFCEK